jgi:hypothetical protein
MLPCVLECFWCDRIRKEKAWNDMDRVCGKRFSGDAGRKSGERFLESFLDRFSASPFFCGETRFLKVKI